MKPVIISNATGQRKPLLRLREADSKKVPALATDPCTCCGSDCEPQTCTQGWARGSVGVIDPEPCFHASHMPRLLIRDTSRPPPGWCYTHTTISNAAGDVLYTFVRQMEMTAYADCYELRMRSFATCCDAAGHTGGATCYDDTVLDVGAMSAGCCCYPITCVTDYLLPGNTNWVLPVPSIVTVWCNDVFHYVGSQLTMGFRTDPSLVGPTLAAAGQWLGGLLPGAFILPLAPRPFGSQAIARYEFVLLGDVLPTQSFPWPQYPQPVRPYLRVAADLYCNDNYEHPTALSSGIGYGLTYSTPDVFPQTQPGDPLGCVIGAWAESQTGRCGGSEEFPDTETWCYELSVFIRGYGATW